MVGTVTVTATTGPGNTVTALVLTDVTNVEYDLEGEVVRVKHSKGYSEFSLVGVTVVTTTTTGVTGSAVTVVIE